MLNAITLTLAAMLGSPNQVVNLSLYSGAPIGSNGSKIMAWGGGSIAESGDQSIAGNKSLQVKTTSYFSGGILELGSSADVSTLANNKENLLQVSVFVVRNGAAPSGGGGAAPAGGGGRPTEMGGAQAGGSGGGSGMAAGSATPLSGGSASAGGAAPSATPSAIKQMEKLRIVIRTSDGKISEAVIPLSAANGSTGRWRRLGVPLSTIPGFAKTNKNISAIAVSGDAPATFYLGEVRVVTDQTAIQGQLSHSEMNVGKTQEVTLWANGEAGFSVLKYSWDFDEKDGIQDESSDQVLLRKFRQAGEFVITCTISDAAGLKKPWVGKIKVTVNP